MVRIIGMAVAAAMLLAGPASAQSLTPMRGEVRSLEDRFALRVFPRNPYEHRIRLEVKVYDQDFYPVEAEVFPPDMLLGGGASRAVLVRVPFEGERRRQVRVCIESVPLPNQTQIIRTQICGKFIATRLR